MLLAIPLTAQGLTHAEIAAHLAEVSAPGRALAVPAALLLTGCGGG
jgi:hypothetical protein